MPLIVNPFEDDAVREPRAVGYSVAGLNDKPLERLLDKFERLVSGELPRLPVSANHAQLVMSPDAGYGKSHLLGRLFQKLRDRATLIYLRPFQDPQRAWSSILRTTVQELELPSEHGDRRKTQLEEFATGVLFHVANEFKVSAEELQAHLDNADGMVKLSRLLHQREVRLDGREKAWLRVLAACAFSKSDSLAQDAALTWLRGERLEEDQVSVLKISATDNDAGADASDRQVNELCLGRLRGFCLLASYYRPFVFCFDQTEFYGSDPALADALGECIWWLHGSIRNHLTVVTANANNWAQDVRPRMKPPSQARFSSSIDLEGINDRQAKELLETRLREFQLRDEEIEDFIEPTWLAAQFQTQPHISVRSLLVLAAERFRSQLPTAVPRPKVPIQESFAIEVNKMRARPAMQRYNQDCLMWFFEALVKGFEDVTVSRSEPGVRYFSVKWECPACSVYFATEAGHHHMRWLSIANEAIGLAAMSPGKVSAIIFRTPDLETIPRPKWDKVQQKIELARNNGLYIVSLSADEVCELHAAREFYSNALQGDVDHAPNDVFLWLQRYFKPWFQKYSRCALSPQREVPAAVPGGTREPAPLPISQRSHLSPTQIELLVSYVKAKRLVAVEEVLQRVADGATKDALLRAVEDHPNLKAHPGPQSIILQWRV